MTTPSHGTWTRSGNKLHFKGGKLSGKTGTLKPSETIYAKVWISFRHWIDGGDETCQR